MQASTSAVPMSGCLSTSRPATASRTEQGDHHRPRRCDPVGPAGQQVGGEHGHGQLHELRGLDAQLPETDPPARSPRHHADAGDEHGHEQAEGATSSRTPARGATSRSASGRRRRRRWRPAPSTGPGARRSSTPTRSHRATCRPRPTAPSPGRCRTRPSTTLSKAVRVEMRSRSWRRRPSGACRRAPDVAADQPQMAGADAAFGRAGEARRRGWRPGSSAAGPGDGRHEPRHAHARRGRSRRPARRRTRTSRTTRTPGTAARRHPARPVRAVAAATASAMEGAV